MINLMKGDCLERMKELKGGSVDMILTDPPYGTTACKWDSIIPLEPMWEQLKRIIKPNGAIVMTASQPFTSILGASNIGQLKYSWTWEKSKATGHLNAKRMPMRSVEDVLVFYKKPPTYIPQMTKGKPYKGNGGSTRDTDANYGTFGSKRNDNKGIRYPKQIIKVASETKPVYPTQKPVTLMEYLIKTYTNEGETVLDFTMGSGSTGVACKNLNRSFIGIEMDDKYFEIAKERLSSSTLQQELF